MDLQRRDHLVQGARKLGDAILANAHRHEDAERRGVGGEVVGVEFWDLRTGMQALDPDMLADPATPDEAHF